MAMGDKQLKPRFRILAGACIKQDPVVLKYYLQSLEALQIPKDADLRFGFVNDGDDAQRDRLSLIRDLAIVLPAEPRPAESGYAIGPDTHHWQVGTFEHLARQKQRLLNYAIEAGYTHVFLVDSDLLLEPTTLISLWETKADIVNAAFWTAWSRGGPPQPQCWLSHPYGLAGLGMEEHEFLEQLAKRQAVRIAGGGACVLASVETLKHGVRYHPRLAGLPSEGMWQGEDRTFAILAQRLHERQLADGWPDIFHAYHPEQRTSLVLDGVWEFLNAPRQQYAKYGDLISLVLDPMEDKVLADSLATKPELRCIRGRLGALDLAPEIEEKVLGMKPGDEALVDIHFSYYTELLPYRGQSKVIRIKMIDCKPYGFAPTLAEHAFAGVANG